MVNTLKNTADEIMADRAGKHPIWERESNSSAASMKQHYELSNAPTSQPQNPFTLTKLRTPENFYLLNCVCIHLLY